MHSASASPIKCETSYQGASILTMSIGPVRRFGGVAAVALLASGCAGPASYDLVTAHNARIALEPAQGDRPVMLRVEGKPPQPLPGLMTAQIDLVWSAPKSDFIVLHGASKDCPRSAWLATIIDGDVSLHALGECRDQLALIENGDRLLVKRLQPGADSTIIVYHDGSPNATYAMLRDTPARRHGVAAGHAGPAQEKPPEDEVDHSTAATEALPEVPPVSSRVGDSVVPAPVGAGPLPAGAARLSPPFATSPQ